MEATQLKNQIQTHVNSLSSERLKVALDFLSYLADKEADEATQELLDIPNFREELAEAKKQVAAGEVYDWRTIRDDV